MALLARAAIGPLGCLGAVVVMASIRLAWACRSHSGMPNNPTCMATTSSWTINHPCVSLAMAPRQEQMRQLPPLGNRCSGQLLTARLTALAKTSRDPAQAVRVQFAMFQYGISNELGISASSFKDPAIA